EVYGRYYSVPHRVGAADGRGGSASGTGQGTAASHGALESGPSRAGLDQRDGSRRADSRRFGWGPPTHGAVPTTPGGLVCPEPARYHHVYAPGDTVKREGPGAAKSDHRVCD